VDDDEKGHGRVGGDAMDLGGVERILSRARLRRGTMDSFCGWSSIVNVPVPQNNGQLTYSEFADIIDVYFLI